MRILHIIQRYWPAHGGAEHHLAELSRRLAADGHEVTVATTDALDIESLWDPRLRRIDHPDDLYQGVQIRRFPVRHLPGGRIAYSGVRRALSLLSAAPSVPVSWLARLARLTPRVPDLRRWLAGGAGHFDLVAGMTICFEPLLEAGLSFARRRGIPFVIYPLVHLGAGPQPGRDSLSRFYTMRHQNALVGASDALVAQTAAERDFYRDRGAAPAEIVVAGPGVDPVAVVGGDGERFRRRHGVRGPIIASLSALTTDKGATHLVEAVRRLWQMGRTVDLVLGGAILPPFQRYLAGLPDEDRRRLRVLGAVTDAEKRDLLAAADVFAMPSRSDSFGIVYLEAWLYRKPVVGARTWGVSDVIDDGHDGRLTPFGDVAALAEALAYLLDNPAARAEMGAAGEHKVLSRHTWDHKHPMVRDLYCRLAMAGPRAVAEPLSDAGRR